MKTNIDPFKWVMIVSGLLTCTMIYAVIAPQAALQSTFGETISGPVAEIVVRNWGALITLIGIMLIYGAFAPLSRAMILIVAAASKLTFIYLIVEYGSPAIVRKATFPIAFDSLMVALYLIYLLNKLIDARRNA